jgi:anti-anti-sigma factor
MSLAPPSRSADDERTSFSVVGRVVGDDVLVDVTGDIDLATADLLDEVLQDAVATVEGDIVIDASRVTFIDSTGLATLARASRTLGGERSVRLARPSPPVRRTLELANMLDFFPVVE